MSTTPEQSSRAGFQAAGAVVSLAVLMVLAACVGNGNQAGPAAPGSGVVSSGPMPSGSPSPGPLTANVISAEPAVNLHAERWASAEPVSGTREVLVHGTLTGGPPCAVLGRVEVAESQSRVTITLWVGQRKDATCDGPQPAIGYPFATRVTLSAPLGEREVRDGAA